MFDVWKNVLEELKQLIPHNDFNVWFKDVSLLSITDGVAIIEVPNVFKQKYIKEKYNNIIHDTLTHNSVVFTDIKYVISSHTTVKPRSREISFDSIKTSKSKELASSSKQHLFSSGLKPEYTMQNFVVASNNDFVVSVAWAMIKEPGKKYNPFFIYGGPGLGKTHLVQAIGNEMLRNNPGSKILYIPMNHFYSEFVKAIRQRKIDDFLNKYTGLDVLIIDDFQMIIGKDASQTQFFDIFNDMYQKGKQIIITCDRMPEQLKELDARLTTRLSWAGAYDIQMPNFEDRCAILRAKADFEGIEIEDEAIEFIANNNKTSIRDLEGEFRKIITYADFKKTTPLNIIKNGFLNSSNKLKNNLITPKKIIDVVSKYYNITPEELCSKSRVFNIKNARQVAMFLISEELGYSTTKSALEVGLKDHTTAMHGIKKIKSDLETDFTLRDQISTIREKLYE
ncbi:chromosomal replication initiator protein DnaA [Candidatus Saccharibacteria bacterium]|nr:chromosomal replication initiator protein DnaA [Candidatus Saccharibacteria bacterium]